MRPFFVFAFVAVALLPVVMIFHRWAGTWPSEMLIVWLGATSIIHHLILRDF